MDFDFLKEKNASKAADYAVGIVLISGTCCNPSLAVADERARRVIEKAAAEVGVEVRVELMTMTSAYYSAPKDVRQRLMKDFSRGNVDLPAVLIGGKAVSYGVPAIDAMKAALLDATNRKKEEANE